MKLYTKSGDDGTTGLFGGDRVSKHHPRVEAYGTVDELNACLGLAVVACDDGRPVTADFAARLTAIQSRLFDLGADLATPSSAKHAEKITRIGAAHIEELEHAIDTIDGANAPMQHFVLPGGTALAAHLHLARTVCRRAERLVAALDHQTPVGTAPLRYLNRLSDLLFAMARRANADAGVADVPWIPG